MELELAKQRAAEEAEEAYRKELERLAYYRNYNATRPHRETEPGDSDDEMEDLTTGEIVAIIFGSFLGLLLILLGGYYVFEILCAPSPKRPPPPPVII